MKKHTIRRAYFLLALTAASLSFYGFFDDVKGFAGDVYKEAKNAFGSTGALFQNVFGTACKDILSGTPFSQLCPSRPVFPGGGPIGSDWQVGTLAMQRRLEIDLPLKDSTFLHTHNSYNANAYANVLPPRYLDPNQVYSIYDQLRMGIRAVELDVHHYFSTSGILRRRPLLCHAKENHIGCSIYDRTLEEGLDEIARFARENPSEVILVYIEEYLANNYQDALNRIKSKLGDRIYRPVSAPGIAANPICAAGRLCGQSARYCRSMPVELTRRNILNAHKNIVLYSNNCGKDEWLDWVYRKDGASIPEASISKSSPHPKCGTSPDGKITVDSYANMMVRYYEDKTNLSKLAGSASGDVTPAQMAEMIRCGVNLPGMDKLKPDDGRLEAAVFTWNKGEPNNSGGNEDCAMQYANGRWNDSNCGNSFRFACRNDSGAWKITAASGPWSEGSKLCAAEHAGYRFAVPRNGEENHKLVAARSAQGGFIDAHVWLKYSDIGSEGTWKE